jgi:hypothetical protein
MFNIHKPMDIIEVHTLNHINSNQHITMGEENVTLVHGIQSLYSITSIDVILGCLAMCLQYRGPDVSGIFAKSATLARLLEAGWTLVAAMFMDQRYDAGGLFQSLVIWC